MAINKIKVPYEILFRLHENGDISGCHRRDIEKVLDADSGEVYSEKEMDPEQISHPGLGDIFSSLNVSALSTISSNNIKISALESDLERKEIKHVEKIEEISSQLDLAHQMIEQHEALIISLQNQINSLAPAQ